jgi:hypothetical protein
MDDFTITYEQLTDSRDLAKDLNIEHSSFYRTIKKYRDEIESDFGEVQFLTEKTKGRGGKPPCYALLTESQALLLVLLANNTPEAREAKLGWIQRYSEIRTTPSPFFLDLVNGTSPTQNTPDKKPLQRKKEKMIEASYLQTLLTQGINARSQVSCKYGVADIVTPDAIYEIKGTLSKSSLQQAIGQVLIYRSCINPSAKAFVIGCLDGRNNVDITMGEALGVEVIVWKNQK